jgi:methionine biosynthesis protein MetW
MNFNELTALRADLAFIAHWVAPGSRVLDLGCGDGVMLDYLQSAKQCAGYGVEIDDVKIPACIARNVPVIQQDLEAGLAIFADNAFDSVLCLSALQMMKNVEGVLRDIARVGAEAIVSFPNFAYWPHRVRDGVLYRRASRPTRDLAELDAAWLENPQNISREEVALEAGVISIAVRVWANNANNWRAVDINAPQMEPLPAATVPATPNQPAAIAAAYTGLEISLQLQGTANRMTKVFLLGAV